MFIITILKALDEALIANQNLEKVEQRQSWTKFEQETPPFKLKAVQDAMIKHATHLNNILYKNPGDPEAQDRDKVKLIIPWKNLLDNLALPRDEKVISLFLSPLDQD